MSALLTVTGLSVSAQTPAGSMPIVQAVSLTIGRGEAVAVVGESGSGKSVLMSALLQLLPAGLSQGAGSIDFRGQRLDQLKESELCKLRGRQIALVPQEPKSAWNPVLTLGAQVQESLLLHKLCDRREAKERALSWLEKVGLPQPSRTFAAYPHEVSGGMLQRALLAAALATEPDLLIADEPTAAMDRSTEHALLSLLAAEQQRRGLSLLLVSHDLVRVASMADRTYVLYAGEVVEEASREGLRNARHPYTRALLASRPDPARLRADPTLSRRLAVLPGSPPRFERLPGGCRFAPRCVERFERCLDHPPLASDVAGAVRCHAASALNQEADADEAQPKEASA